MIYRNFLYFVAAVALFVAAPSTANDLLPVFEDILIILALIFLFSHHVRNIFYGIRRKYPEEDVTPGKFKKEYQRKTNLSLIKAVILFGIELYLFDLKVILTGSLSFGGITFVGDIIVLAVFILHFTIVWYWGYKMAGDIIYLGKDIKGFIKNNIKFNLAIMIPWLILTIITDLLRILNISWIMENSGSLLFQLVFLSLFLLIFTILGPVLIIRLWNCEPLEKGHLREVISDFTVKAGVSFREILSWNSLNRSLLTAGVIGFFPRFRYLLLTPELMDLLSTEEIIAVVSHETGHVKRKHLLYYLLFFIGFVVFSSGFMSIINLLVMSTPIGIGILLDQNYILGINVFNLVLGALSVFIFIAYFRYIFGYFMRNFEREADTYCFDSGVEPEYLISSFEKLGSGTREKRGSNWHHYSLEERVEFLNKCISDPAGVSKHRKKIKKSLLTYLVALVTMMVVTLNPMIRTFSSGMEKKVIIRALEKSIERSPLDYRLYSATAALYHEIKNWEKAGLFYEKSLSIKYAQPETLNNLAWLLITCEDESFREKRRGLRLAKDAAALKHEPHIYDTLAEAFLLNEKYEEAVRAAETARGLARGDLKYFKKQLKKMKKYYRISRSTFKL